MVPGPSLWVKAPPQQSLLFPGPLAGPGEKPSPLNPSPCSPLPFTISCQRGQHSVHFTTTLPYPAGRTWHGDPWHEEPYYDQLELPGNWAEKGSSSQQRKQ
ncbi:hypothetical protein FKM82_001072 [Ascaphus truei]